MAFLEKDVFNTIEIKRDVFATMEITWDYIMTLVSSYIKKKIKLGSLHAQHKGIALGLGRGPGDNVPWWGSRGQRPLARVLVKYKKILEQKTMFIFLESNFNL